MVAAGLNQVQACATLGLSLKSQASTDGQAAQEVQQRVSALERRLEGELLRPPLAEEHLGEVQQRVSALEGRLEAATHAAQAERPTVSVAPRPAQAWQEELPVSASVRQILTEIREEILAELAGTCALPWRNNLGSTATQLETACQTVTTDFHNKIFSLVGDHAAKLDGKIDELRDEAREIEKTVRIAERAAGVTDFVFLSVRDRDPESDVATVNAKDDTAPGEVQHAFGIWLQADAGGRSALPPWLDLQGPHIFDFDRSPRSQRMEFQTKRLARTLELRCTQLDFWPNRGKGEVKVDRMSIARIIVPTVPDEPSKTEWKQPEAKRLGIDCGSSTRMGSDAPWSSPALGLLGCPRQNVQS
ncbi:unnamed protein product [Prorocentrum cordatum]|uniref:Uncharacterized protein n=1 Tax=Prorocentrum cordatum TaxID=2364126 RepID=A0ABN9VK96_9DINO|nr:unnamed protein product [Polarella glacialis]